MVRVETDECQNCKHPEHCHNCAGYAPNGKSLGMVYCCQIDCSCNKFVSVVVFDEREVQADRMRLAEQLKEIAEELRFHCCCTELGLSISYCDICRQIKKLLSLVKELEGKK